MPTYVDTIVCEDVRSELGNKVTLAGVFGDEVVLSVIPMTLPSFAIMQRWRVSTEEVDRGVGQFTFGLEAPDAQLQRFPPMPTNPPVKGVYVTTMSFILKFGGLPIRLKGEYKFKTYLNGVEIHSNSFFVLTNADVQAAQQAKAIGFKPPVQ